MSLKARLLLALVHFIARIQGGVLWIKRNLLPTPPKPPGPERVLILNPDTGDIPGDIPGDIIGAVGISGDVSGNDEAAAIAGIEVVSLKAAPGGE